MWFVQNKLWQIVVRHSDRLAALQSKSGVTGIQGKRERERERKAGTGTCKNRYLSDSLLMKFSKLCKPSHKYSFVVEFFLSHNKRQPAQNSVSTDAIRDLL